MQLYTYYNASLVPQCITGHTPLAPGAKLVVMQPSVEIDPDFTKLQYTACLVGLIAANGALTTFSAVLTPTIPLQIRSTTGTIATTARGVVGVTNGAGFTYTLPAASAVPSTATIYVFNDVNGGANDLTVARAGSDTIDGETTSKVLTPSANTLRFVSDGVSAWTTH